MPNECVWSIVLAAGNGKRLTGLARNESGASVPKQFWRIDGTATMLGWTMERAAAIAARQRIVTVVAESHRRWWGDSARDGSLGHVVVQPENRGTAAGILLPLLRVLEQDPDATVAVLPSDHFVQNEEILLGCLRRAVLAVERDPATLVLLGMTPSFPDPEYGWILPDPLSSREPREVAAFVEKPDLLAALSLERQGALWNTFLSVGRAATLAEVFREIRPDLWDALREAATADTTGTAGLRAAYEGLPVVDFSRDLLQAAPHRLGVLAVPPCGWTDLGTPVRLSRWREALSASAA